MSGKLLISLNGKVEIDFRLTYLGCRMIDSEYTQSKLISSLLNNAIDNKEPMLVVDGNCRFYKSSECYAKGLDYVNQVLEGFYILHLSKGINSDLSEELVTYLIPRLSVYLSKDQSEIVAKLICSRIFDIYKLTNKFCLYR